LTAIVKIVTTYTRPGQRVLLVDPAPYLAPPVSWPASGHARSRPGPYAGLQEAGWTVVRLGRGVRTQTAVADPEPPGGLGSSPVVASADANRYDLVITAVEPRALDWFRPAGWADLLTSTGTLAVITRSHRERDRLTDPAGRLVRAAHQAGLRYLDRIALLRVAVRNSALAVEAPAAQLGSQASAASVRHLAAHDDLLVFTHRPAPMPAIEREETSDE
jgi:hypothetical protein